jgi:hypothetical protein
MTKGIVGGLCGHVCIEGGHGVACVGRNDTCKRVEGPYRLLGRLRRRRAQTNASCIWSGAVSRLSQKNAWKQLAHSKAAAGFDQVW